MPKIEAGPIASENVRNVNDTNTLEKEYVDVAIAFAMLLAHVGYISEFIAHGSGPKLEAKNTMKTNRAIIES